MSAGTRLLGLGGVGLVILLIFAGATFTWWTYSAPPAPAQLSVFDVAPPAAPPEPASEVPPRPEQAEREKPFPEPKRPKVDPPEIILSNDHPVPQPVVKATPNPGPPVKEMTAPTSKPAPPAQQVSTSKPTWEGLVLGALNKAKRYPRTAQAQRQQGVPFIRFVMDRDGKVLSVRLERSSGHSSLDQEALALPKRAQPLPKPPDDVPGNTIELVVPVEFFIKVRP